MKLKQGYYLFLLPLLLFFFLEATFLDAVYFFVSWTDPVYPYLFNGLNLASGRMEVGHIDHPGTTVPLFMTLVIKIVNLFRNEPLVLDVLTHPELYLKIASQIVIIALCTSLYFLGLRIQKLYENLKVSLFFQLAPFFSFITIGYIRNPMPEPFLVMAVWFLIPFWLKLFKGQPINLFVIIGLITGFILATKITAIALVFLPLFFIKSLKQLLVYGFSILISFSVFCFPILFRMDEFYNWIVNLTKHSGHYGNGAEGFVDASSLASSITDYLTNEWIYTVCFFALVFTSIFSLIRNIRTEYSKLLFGLTFVYSLHTFIVLKHYSYHYFIPLHCMIPVMIFVVYKHLDSSLREHSSKQSVTNYFVSFKALNIKSILLIAILLLSRDIYVFSFNKTLKHPSLETINRINNLDAPCLIAASGNSSHLATGLEFGWVYSGKLKAEYATVLGEIYPNAFLTNGHIHTLKNSQTYYDFLTQNKSFYVYKKDSLSSSDDFAKMMLLLEKNNLVSKESDYLNAVSREQITKYRVTDNLSKITVREYYTEFDSISIAANYWNGRLSLPNSKDLWVEKINGQKQLYMDATKAYSFNTKLKLKPNCEYKIETCISEPDSIAFMVVQNDKGYWSSSKTTEQIPFGYKQNICFPASVAGSDSMVSIYYWDLSGKMTTIKDFYIQEIEYR